MFKYDIKAGTADVSVVLRVVDATDGTPETGVDHATSGIDLKYRREGAANVDITEAALAALTTAHTDGGVEQIGNGYIRVDLPDAACAAGVAGVLVHGTITGMVVIGCYIQLIENTQKDVFDRIGAPAGASVSADLSALKTVADAIKAKTDQMVFTIANKLDSSIQAAADFAQAAADKVWSTAARILTAGTNIVLAKGTGVTGFNDLSAAQVNAEVDTGLADYDGPTHTELLNLIRLALRKDAALVTDLAALITSINADLGSGAGAFANTTDSQEAIRDNMGTAQTGDAYAIVNSGTHGNAALKTLIDAIDDFIDTEMAATLAAAQDIQGRLPAALVGGRMDSSVGALAAAVITAAAIASDAIGALELSTDAAEEIRDAVWAKVLTELSQGVPSATPSAANAVMLLYMALRNKLDVDADFKEVHNDAGTVICKKALSDDGTTYSEGEMETGP